MYTHFEIAMKSLFFPFKLSALCQLLCCFTVTTTWARYLSRTSVFVLFTVSKYTESRWELQSDSLNVSTHGFWVWLWFCYRGCLFARSQLCRNTAGNTRPRCRAELLLTKLYVSKLTCIFWSCRNICVYAALPVVAAWVIIIQAAGLGDTLSLNWTQC